jgi:FdhE protein
MPRTTGSLRSDATARLNDLARLRPEWRSWTGLLDIAWQAVNDTGWSSPLDQTELGTIPYGSPQDAPLLHGQRLRLDAARARRLVHRLASATGEGDLQGGLSLQDFRPSPEEALSLISSALRQDVDAMAAHAAEHGVDPGALAAVAHLATLPLLQSCGRQLEHRLPSFWHAGYCPVCAAWPVLAERRGLDRSRRLRCGRCAADWEVPWLFCIYCGERNHAKLASLEPDDPGEKLKVETCATCRGYLKSIASLQGFSALELLLEDVGTVELDLVALERNYRRPRQSGFALEVHVVADASG